MSNSERRARRELTAQEIMKQVQETGQNLHKSIGYGLTDKQKLDQTDKLSWQYLQEIQDLKLECSPGSSQLKELTGLERKFEAIIKAIQAIRDMPKQKPKNRQAVFDLYFQTQSTLIDIRNALNAKD